VKKLSIALSSGALLMVLGLSSAHAAATCKMIPQFCPPIEQDNGGPSEVPEPATIALLAAGVGALGLRAYRRNKQREQD
jgi:hypothetical protein